MQEEKPTDSQTSSDSEEIEAPLNTLTEKSLQAQHTAMEAIMETSKISQKARIEQVKLFKSKLVNFLTIFCDKGENPSKIFHKIPDLLIYSFFTPDSSSSALSNKIQNFIVKFFNKFSKQLQEKEFLEENNEELKTTIDVIFQLMKKLHKIKKNSKLVISIFRKILKIESESIDEMVQENFSSFLDFCLKKKDIMYFECYAKPILNQRKNIFNQNCEKLMDFIRLEEDEGPKNDLMRVKSLNFLINYLRRLQKLEGGDAILKNFAKKNSKKFKKILASVLVEQNPFKKKPIKMYMKYLELTYVVLNLYLKFGLKKKFKSTKKALIVEIENLPKDQNLKKMKTKILTLIEKEN